MENQSFEYLPKLKDSLKIAAHWAIIIAIVISLRLMMTIYYVVKYYSNLEPSVSNNFQIYSYLGNSIIDVILSSLSAFFLYQFAQYAYQNCRSMGALDGAGIFANFRNYLVVAIILSLNWLFFGVMNLVSGFFM